MVRQDGVPTVPSQNARNIALTPQLMDWVDELVQTGEYSSASEVLRDGLRALRERRERHAAELDGIRARIASSLDQADRGEFAEGSGEDAMRRAFERPRRRRASEAMATYASGRRAYSGHCTLDNSALWTPSGDRLSG
ncbi:MAG: type II toxin-antitoxin system ParD family antitoxin [Rhizobiales bacterium]|nr:type II toxin-antitoxin system ParD family antitoxin [Hyphomicrobiales bacterium]